MIKQCFLSFCLIVGTTCVHSQVVINELMQSNVDCVMDGLNNFPDSWVELYNAGDENVSLQQFQLGTTEDASSAWQLPDLTLEKGKHLLVYCDKEGSKPNSLLDEKADEERRTLHTDFRLDSGKGCSVYLFHHGTICDKVAGLAKQPAPNIAFGRATDGGNQWGYMLQASPGLANTGGVSDKLLSQPIFSMAGGVFQPGRQLTLEMKLPDDAPEEAVIRYTLDGSEPTTESVAYTTALNISQTTVVRAKLFCDGWLTPRSTTHSYIFFPRAKTMPIISLVTDSAYFYDSKIGIYVDGDYSKTYRNYVFDWRRPANIEVFADTYDMAAVNQLGEVRDYGTSTREMSVKSLVFYANKRFGTKRLKYEFFPTDRPGMDKFKSILLRNGGQDYTGLHMRDALIQHLMGTHCDMDWQAWQPSVVFLNGQYLGLLNLRERSNEDYIYSHYDGLEDVDIVENYSKLNEGSMDNFNEFKDFYSESGHTLAEYEERLDVHEFFNVVLTHLFFANTDFFGNNTVMWRARTEGGRWRLMAKDLDNGLAYNQPYNFKSLDYFSNPSSGWQTAEQYTLLFRQLMDNDSCRNLFIDQAAVYMGDFLNCRTLMPLLDSMVNVIRDEYKVFYHKVAGGTPDLDGQRNRIKEWMLKRTPFFYTHLHDFFNLGTTSGLRINTGKDEKESRDLGLSINGVHTSRGMFDGDYFQGRTLVIAADGKQSANFLRGWNVWIYNGGEKDSLTVLDDTLRIVMPECDSLHIEGIALPVVEITQMGYATFSWPQAVSFDGMDGITAYVVEKYDHSESLKLKRVISVPANTGIIVKGPKGSYYPKVASSATTPVTNLLTATSNTRHTVASSTEYVLSNINGVVGFYRAKEGVHIKKYHAYINLDVENAKNALFFEATNGMKTTSANATPSSYFSIGGIHLDKPLTRGIFISRGKKVITKTGR